MTAIYQVDAFTDTLFGGNPAAVVPFDSWPADSLLQSIANENNLAETAFIVLNQGQWEIRWFTPTAEVALCGHATLAAAHVAFHHLRFEESTITFKTRESGMLSVSRVDDGRLSMSFPAIAVSQHTELNNIATAMGSQPSVVLKGHYSENQYDFVAVYESETDVARLQPTHSHFAALGSRGVIATAPSNQCDFVSRYFAPAFGIPEDPVTGSAHCLLAPYWADQLGKSSLSARQISARGGVLECQVASDRVVLIGNAVDYLHGSLSLPK